MLTEFQLFILVWLQKNYLFIYLNSTTATTTNNNKINGF